MVVRSTHLYRLEPLSPSFRFQQICDNDVGKRIGASLDQALIIYGGMKGRWFSHSTLCFLPMR